MSNPPFQFVLRGDGEFPWDPVVVPEDAPLGSARNPVVVGEKKKKKKTHPFHADTYRQRRRTSRLVAEVQQMAFDAGYDITPALAAMLASRFVIS
jgi:hypothetical protein